jgi:glycosyltransferase involved in cell wall biosynthesis
VRVLVLTPQPLDPVHDGLNLRVYHLFRAMARAHEVSVLHFSEPHHAAIPRAVDASAFADVRAVPVRGRGGAPIRHCEEVSEEAQRAIAACAAERPVDAVVAATIYMVPYAAAFRDRPLVLDVVDAMSLLVGRSIRSAPTWRERLSRVRSWAWWRRYERRHLPAFPHLAVTSPEDARVLARRAPAARVTVLPNGVDAEVFRPMAAPAGPPEVVFTGVMGFHPNAVAAEHFYTRIFPAVRAAVPDVRLTFAGKGPTERLQALVRADAAVTLTGFVDDLRPHIARAGAYVAPMVSGSGIKNKILEAWAMARPVVATPIACASLAGTPGATHFVEPTPEAFAARVVALLRDRALGDAVGRRARQLVLDEYQWSVRADRLAAILGEMCGAPAAAMRPSPVAARAASGAVR